MPFLPRIYSNLSLLFAVVILLIVLTSASPTPKRRKPQVFTANPGETYPAGAVGPNYDQALTLPSQNVRGVGSITVPADIPPGYTQFPGLLDYDKNLVDRTRSYKQLSATSTSPYIDPTVATVTLGMLDEYGDCTGLATAHTIMSKSLGTFRVDFRTEPMDSDGLAERDHKNGNGILTDPDGKRIPRGADAGAPAAHGHVSDSTPPPGLISSGKRTYDSTGIAETSGQESDARPTKKPRMSENV